MHGFLILQKKKKKEKRSSQSKYSVRNTYINDTVCFFTFKIKNKTHNTIGD